MASRTCTYFLGSANCGDGDTFATEIRAAKESSETKVRRPAVSLNPLNWMSGAWHVGASATNAAALAIEGAVEITGGLLRPAATSSLVGPVTTMRRYSAGRVRLEDVAKV